MIVDFEFVSTHRNRTLWPNPCLFEVPWSGSGQYTGLNAVDPVSNQVPAIAWTGQNIAIAATVVSQTNDSVIVSAAANSFSQLANYYRGAELSKPPSFRINSSQFLSQSGGLDYVQLGVTGSGVQAGDAVVIQVTSVPNTIFVPAGSNMPNAYTGQYLYNETQGQSVAISSYDAELHLVLAPIPPAWANTDKYSIRQQLPAVGNFAVGTGNTTTSVNLTGIGGANSVVVGGNFIRVISTGEISKIVSFDTTTNFANISPPLSLALAAGSIVEILAQTSDNYRTLSYAGTAVGQHEQSAYNTSVVSATLPNIPIQNGSGGYPMDYPFLYIELFDTNHPSQNNLFSNNHASKSYFKVTMPTGQLLNRTEKFSKFTGDLNRKTIRFRPTSNFRISWRLPSGEAIQFAERDTQSPLAPNEAIQTSVQFNLIRD